MRPLLVERGRGELVHGTAGTPLESHEPALAVVLVVTVAGGLFAGLVGLIIAAPAAAIARRVFIHVRGSGFFEAVP